jgi:pimeloyl-ACP methyl ester carboxylesterase
MMKPKHLTAIVPLLVSLLIPTTALSAPAVKEVEVNGVRLQYWDQGSGEPMVFVHGGLSGAGAWDAVRDEIAKKYPYRFITYMQRYFGSRPWPDEGQKYSVATHADDLAKFIASLDTGPVHLVGWSYGGLVATTAALKNPSLVRSLILYEAIVNSVLPPESPEGKVVREYIAKAFAPAREASKAGDPVKAIRLQYEAIYQLPPGGFDGLPQETQARVLENARTRPLSFAAPPPPAITCDDLKNFTKPTLVMHGEKSQSYFFLVTEAIGKCVPGARHVVLRDVNHAGPVRDPAAFTAAIAEFLPEFPRPTRTELIRILDIAAWPLVAILAMYLFKEEIQSFLKSRTIGNVSLFGVELKTTGAEIAQVVWENFNHFKPTNRQWTFLVQLAVSPTGVPKADAEKKGLDYKDDFRPLRNAGLMTGNAATINKSDLLMISPLGKFLVKNARDQDARTAEARSIDVQSSAEEDQ